MPQLRRQHRPLTTLLLLPLTLTTLLSPQTTNSFLTPHHHHNNNPQHHRIKTPTQLPANFFSEIFQNAFANDDNLSQDKSEDQLEYDDDDSPPDNNRNNAAMERLYPTTSRTATQAQWDSRQKGAPVDPAALVGARFKLGLFLAGVPDKEPSNNLYGSKVNISQRDRGLDVGVSLPEEPSVEISVSFLEGGVCRIEKSQFTNGENGQYVLSPDNRSVRISLPSTGYTRTVRTTGSITKVYWSEETETTMKTSSTYSIPAGSVYVEAKVGYGRPGEIAVSEGVLRFEKRIGLVGSKMVNCGKVEGVMVREEGEGGVVTKGVV